MIHELNGDDLEKEQIVLETACSEGVIAINMGVTGCKGCNRSAIGCRKGVTGCNGDVTERHRGVSWCYRVIAGCNRV